MTVEPLTEDEIRKIREILPLSRLLFDSTNLAHQMIGRQERFGQELSEIRQEMAVDRVKTTERQFELREVHSLITEQKMQAESDRDNATRQFSDMKDALNKLIVKVDGLLQDPSAIKASDVRKVVWQVIGALVVAGALAYIATLKVPFP